MKKISLIFLYLVYGIGVGGANTLQININTLEDEITLKNITNIQQQYYPEFWSDFKFKKLNDSQKVEAAMKLFLSFPKSPDTVPSSNQPHSPFENYHFYGISICDDAARVFSGILRNNGIVTRVRSLNGHVANEVKIDGKFVYIDPYSYSYPSINGKMVSALEIMELGERDTFVHNNFNKNIAPFSATKNDHFYKLIGEDDWSGEEIHAQNLKIKYTLNPGDKIFIHRWDKAYILPLANSKNASFKKMQDFYYLLDIYKSYINEINSTDRMNSIEIHNKVFLNENILFKGRNSQLSMKIDSPSPIAGISVNIVGNSKGGKVNKDNLFLAVFDSNNGKKIQQKLVTDGKVYLNLENKILNSAKISLVFLGENDDSALEIKDANIVVHTQITSSAYERIKREVSP